MIKKIMLLMLIILMVLSTTAQAQTITMANPGGIAERDIIAYYSNGTMQGYYNSTSVITLDPTLDYIFTLKPIGANPLEDPGDWLSTFFIFLRTNAIPLFVIVGCIGLLAMRRR
jgi:hypothetical protein